MTCQVFQWSWGVACGLRTAREKTGGGGRGQIMKGSAGPIRNLDFCLMAREAKQGFPAQDVHGWGIWSEGHKQKPFGCCCCCCADPDLGELRWSREVTWHCQKVEVEFDTSLDGGCKQVGGLRDDFQVSGLEEYTKCQSRLVMTINTNTVCCQDVLGTAKRWASAGALGTRGCPVTYSGFPPCKY